MKFKIDGRQMTVGENTVQFEVSIWEIEEYKDRLFVLLEYDDYEDGDPRAERNIVAVDQNGRILWRIEMAPEVRVVDGKRMDNSYIGIDPNTGKKDRPVEAYDTTGSCWKVDPETGKVSDPVFSR
jgi:hypothetical protein